MVETAKRIDATYATYAYDASTYSSVILDVPNLSLVLAEVSNTQPSTTTTIGFLTRDPIDYDGGTNLYANYFDIRMADPSGLACTNTTFGMDLNTFHSAPGINNPISHWHSNLFGFLKKAMPCEFDLRGYAGCRREHCLNGCCSDGSGRVDESGRLSCSGGANALVKCHSEGLAWVEFGGKFGIDISIEREWKSCPEYDKTKTCIKVKGGVFGCVCVGLRILGTRSCACLKVDCWGGFCLENPQMAGGPGGSCWGGGCRYAVTGDACLFGFCASTDLLQGEMSFCGSGGH